VSPRLALVTLAVGQPMGQQVYEHELADRAPAELGAGWRVDQLTVRTLRSPLPGTVRLPSRVMATSSPVVRRSVAAIVYRGHDVVHRMDLRLPPARHPEVLTVHDVVSWRFPDEAMPPSDAADSARRAVAVVCPSQFSADEVSSQLGVSTCVAIPNGVHPAFFDTAPLARERLADLGVREPFVLHAGGCTQRKNLAGLAGAWPKVRSVHGDVTLVMMGPPDPRRNALFDPLDGTHLIGRVDDDTARGLMAASSAVVVPSVYEGFGLPALEGMAVGVPVVAARRSSLPEVCGDGAYLVEPDPDGLAEGLVAALDGGPDTGAMVVRARQRASSFSWAASVAAHATFWRAST